MRRELREQIEANVACGIDEVLSGEELEEAYHGHWQNALCDGEITPTDEEWIEATMLFWQEWQDRGGLLPENV